MNKDELKEKLDELKNKLDEIREESYNHADGWEWYCKHPITKEYDKTSAQYRQVKDYKLENLPDYGSHMTLSDFIECCKIGPLFTDYDGFGNYATKDKMSDIYVLPSDITMGIYRKDFTHVVWFNK